MKPLARYATLAHYIEFGRSVGLDPVAMMRSVGLDPAGITSADRWIPAAAIAELLERSAADCARDDFGLSLAARRNLADLGPLSLVIRDEPDVRSALQVLIQHESMYNESLHTRLTERDGLACLRVTLDVGRPGPYPQAIDLVIGVLAGLLRGFLGPAWEPVGVTLRRDRSERPQSYRQVCGPCITFGEPDDSILVYAADLDAPNTMAQPQLRRYTRHLIADTAARPEKTVAARVRELVEVLLPSGRCSIDQVARSLGVERRTVHRKLAGEGLTFTQVRDEVRRDLATHLVRSRRHTLTEVADLLGFSSPSNFTRWFTRQFDTNPSAWRERDRRTDPSA